ncbi:MAG: O-acetyl-ADP-ribose deacetylase [Candidatus Sulfotelmatobacter sp.]|jgi:O-acetyl-ADP-ribose deacetylase (regulator of RNase III)
MDPLRDKDFAIIRVGDPEEVRLLRGDITRYPTDAIVNAANSELLPGGGVCGAIHRAGGPAIAEECRRIRSERGPLQAGQAVATTGGSLEAKYVIHAVGPVWRGGDHGEAESLSSCYRESMRLADELKLHSIAFPAISTGIFGYPVEQAAWVAIPTVIENLRTARHVVLVSFLLFDQVTFETFATAAMDQRRPASGRPYEFLMGTNE